MKESLNLAKDTVAVPAFDWDDRNPGVDCPRLEREFSWNEAQRADGHALWNRVARHDDRVSADAGVVSELDVARDSNVGTDHDRVVHEVVRRAPDSDASGQAREIANRECALGTARDRASRRDVRPIPNLDARREVAVVVDDRVFADLEMLLQANPDVGRDDRRVCYRPSRSKVVQALVPSLL